MQLKFRNVPIKIAKHLSEIQERFWQKIDELFLQLKMELS
jgi:hypothetical protein